MSNKNGWGDKPRCVRQTCNSDSGYIINTGSLLKAEESERQPVHLRRGFLVRGLCVVSDWGQIMETTCTLWCQRSTAGRLHNKSHCVLSSAHLQAGCGAFFFFLCMCSGNVRKKYQHNMVMCSLSLRTVKSGLQLVHNIICRVLRALSWQERETQRTDRKCALWHLHINDFLISVSDWCQRRTASFFLLLPFPYSYRELHSFSAEWSPPPPQQAICTHVTLHFGSHMFITAIRVNSGGLVWQSVHEVPQDTGRTQQPTPARPIPLKSSGVPCAIGRASGEPKHCG